MTKLKKIRERRGLRAADLARLLGVSRACVSVAEKKGIRNAGAADRYAAALNCRPEELMEFKGAAQ